MTPPGDELTAAFAAWREDINSEPFAYEQQWLDRASARTPEDAASGDRS